MDMVKGFKDLTPELRALAGGKGGMLSRMYQSGYPVPEGFVILPTAFQGDQLNNQAWEKIKVNLDAIRKNNIDAAFAVRSSALSEDSAQASFAGEFETVLNIKADEEIFDAIYRVYQSRESERVKVYSSAQGMNQSHQIAVVVQLMVQSEISGVLFTVDPITGSYGSMIGNYVYGLGEQLVSGEANAYDFKLTRPKGKYEGPEYFKKLAMELFRHGLSLERELGNPQDIEWAISKGKLYILQARPITTLTPGNLDTYEVNDSLVGDALWVNTNVGEAVPDIITPFAWSMIRALDKETAIIPGYYVWSGNICGRIYSNFSQRLSVYPLLGINIKFGLKMIGNLFGQIPEGMDIPIYPFTHSDLLKVILPSMIKVMKKMSRASKGIVENIKNNPEHCRLLTERIVAARTKEELLSIWVNELEAYNYNAWWMHAAGSSRGVDSVRVKSSITKLVGIEDANALLSHLRGNSELESLGPVVGISKIIKGELTKEEYLKRYGHRSPHEFELSIAHPAEDLGWLEKQIDDFNKSNIDIQGLLDKQHEKYQEALKRFKHKFPNKIKWLEKQVGKASEAARLREVARSEWTREFRVNRAFALKAGQLTGIRDDIFYLYIDEVIDLLKDNESAIKYINIRKENYEKYKALPTLPTVIRGRFNPFEWVKDSNRRVDYYDSTMPMTDSDQDSQALKGFAGAAGRVEGFVRVLMSPDEGEKLQPGEILVAATTNVGWTTLFPKCAAVITDVGAPLSHAAIVARELGIPAVVGCGNATSRLKTGDKVVVDGGQGIIIIVE